MQILSHSIKRFNIDSKVLLRVVCLVLLLIIDESVGSLRTLPPLYLVYGGFFVIAFSVWWFWKLRYNSGIPKTPISSVLIIYLGITGISTLMSVDQRRSFDGLLGTTAVVIIFFIICDLFLSGWNTETFIWAILIFVSLLILQGLFEILEWYWKWFLLRVDQYPMVLLRFRLFGISAWPSKFVMLIYIALPFVIFKLSSSNGFWRKTIWVMWILIAEVCFIYSDTRGGMVAGFVVLLISLGWLIFHKGFPQRDNLHIWYSQKKKVVFSIFSFIISYLLIYWIWQLPSHTGATRHGGGISAGRFSFWQVAIDMLKDFPLFGGGPITYPRFYIEDYPSGLYGWISPHAHNLFLNTLANLGFAGFLLLVVILLVILFQSIKSLKSNQLSFSQLSFNKSSLIVGIAAGLIGIFIHSMFDRLEETPHTMLILLLLVVALFHELDLIKPTITINRKFSWLFFFLPVISIFVIFRINSAQDSQLQSIRNAYENNWQEATDKIRYANELDPELNFYKEQLGYSLGTLAISPIEGVSVTEIEEAVISYQLAIEGSPNWGPNYVNLAGLFSIAGKNKESLKILELMPPAWLESWALPQLMVAERYENIGNFARSQTYYLRALEINYFLIDTTICIRSNLCKETSKMINNLDKDDYNLHSRLVSLVDKGEPQIALSILNTIPHEESSALTWIDRALVHCTLKEYKQCDYSLSVAERLYALNEKYTASLYSLISAELKRDEGSKAEALGILEAYARPMIRFNNYESIIYQRVGFPLKLLPWVDSLEKSKTDLLVYEELEEIYRELNRDIDAEWARNQSEILSIQMKIN